MLILGLHFGHDASVSLVKDGKILVCIEKERQSRLKHAIGLDIKDILKALKFTKHDLSDVDFCSVTSTQNIEYLFFNPKKLNFKIKLNTVKSDKNHWLFRKNLSVYEPPFKKNLLNLIYNNKKHPYVKRLETNKIDFKNINFVGSIENFFDDKSWIKGMGLKKIDRLLLKEPLSKKMQNSMQLPIVVNIKGKKIKGFLMSHHYAHAAYAYYTSNFREAAILTQDGSSPKTSYLSGMCYYGKNNCLYPMLPHYLSSGRIYETVSEIIGFDNTSGPGKMMGLAPYGKPKFFNKRYVGNMFDYKKIRKISYHNKRLENILNKKKDCASKWIYYCLNKAKKNNYNLSYLGDLKNILLPINVDVASSTQLLLEETLLMTVKKMKSSYKKKNIKTNNLCLSGGTMLNCPSNSKIFNKKIYKNVFVPPAAHDGGLSTGSSLALYYNTLQKKRKFNYGNDIELGLLGLKNKESQINKVLKKYKEFITYKKIRNPFKKIGEELSKDKIVSIVFGRSEIGPRALGNRSILADPRIGKNWSRVNNIKKRESWRPFAPVIIDKFFSKYFYGSPKDTPFMLFTARVKNKKLPAITHVDNSARVQTVSKKKSEIYKILQNFKKITNIPVLLNTSFNGPGEPIVETSEDAIKFFLKTKIDLLFINNLQIKKRS